MIVEESNNEIAKKIVPLIIMTVIFLSMSLACPKAGVGDRGVADETQSVRDVARKYLDAEVSEDHDAVWGMLAPSSVYVKTHSYEEYLAEAKGSPVSVVEYRILAISGISENDDRATYPDIQSFARVEVELTLFSRDTGTYDVVNIDFTFVKEGNRWYKG